MHLFGTTVSILLILAICCSCGNNPNINHENQNPQVLNKIDSLLEIAAAQPNARLASEMAEEAYHLADSAKIPNAKARAAHMSGLKFKLWGDQKSSVKRLEEALHYYRDDVKDQTMANEVLVDLGETYRAAGNLQYAADLLQQAIRDIKHLKNEELLAKAYDRQAAVYFELFYNHPVYDSITQLSKENQDHFKLTLMQDAPIQTIHDSLVFFLQVATELARKNNLYDIIFSTQIIKAAHFRITNQYEEAKKVYDELHDLMESNRLWMDLPLVLINKATLIYPTSKEAQYQALALLEQSIQLSEKYQIRIYLAMAYELIHKVYAELRMYDQAYAYLDKAHLTYLQIFDDYKDLLLKSKDIELQQQEKANREANEKAKNRGFILSLSMGCLFIFIFAGILYKKNLSKKKLISDVKSKNELIVQQSEHLLKLNHQKDIFLSIIAHDLKSPLSSIYGLSDLLIQSLSDEKPENIHQFAMHIHRSSGKTIDLLDNLVIWIKSQTGKIVVEYKAQNIRELVSQSIAVFQETAASKNIRLNNNIPDQTMVFGDFQTIATTVRNLISNAIKFSFPGGEINVDALQLEEFIQISVTDNGIGMSETIQEQLFEINKKSGREGTAGEASTGLGLLLCKEMIHLNHGTIGFESEEGKGSRFFFTIPMASQS